MKKCEVLQDTVIKVLKGSTVIVNDKTFELAKSKLKPLDVKKEVKVQEVETREEKEIEMPEEPKKRNRKK